MATSAKAMPANSAGAKAMQDFPAMGKANYTTTVVRTVDEFATLAAEWGKLLEASGEDSISLHHTWLRRWLEVFPPGELLTVLIRDAQGQLMGAAPLLISRNASGLACRLLRRVQFIGTAPDVYDWMKMLIHPQAEAETVLRMMGQELVRNQARWDVLDLRFFECERQLETLLAPIQPAIRQVEITQPMTVPFIDLPVELADYPATLRKKKYHSDLRRIHNHIHKDFDGHGPRLVIHQPGAESDVMLEAFLKTHQRYWMDRGSRTEYGRHRKLVNFYQAIQRDFSNRKESGRPIFEFSTLELGDKPVSYHFDIQARRGCMGYLSSYDATARKYRPGHLHIEALIEHTHQLGGRRFEFGRGDESYKNQWHIDKKPLWSLLAFRNTISHWLWQVDDCLKERYRNGKTSHGTSD